MNDRKKICFVVPVFNEQENIALLVQELTSVAMAKPYDFELIFVDDGSSDDSLNIIKGLAQVYPYIFYIELSRNFGHQYALKAGLDLSDGDCVISLDCDLQHPPEVVTQMIEKWEEGYDIVYTRRKDDRKLPWLKRTTSSLFYKALNSISDLKLENGTADFRLMNRKAVDSF